MYNEKTMRWEAVSDIRQLRGLSQREIARRLGVNQSSVARAEAGIPALSPEYLKQMSAIIAIDLNFLEEKKEYPFVVGSFSLFRVRGLRYRLHPLKWLEVLSTYTEELRVLLLLRRHSSDVLAACVKDDKNSIFLVEVAVPLTYKTVFDFVNQARGKSKTEIYVAGKEYFDARGVAGPAARRSFAGIENFTRAQIESMIEDTFAELFTDDEKKLIADLRRLKIAPSKMSEYAEKLSKTKLS